MRNLYSLYKTADMAAGDLGIIQELLHEKYGVVQVFGKRSAGRIIETRESVPPDVCAAFGLVREQVPR